MKERKTEEEAVSEEEEEEEEDKEEEYEEEAKKKKGTIYRTFGSVIENGGEHLHEGGVFFQLPATGVHVGVDGRLHGQHRRHLHIRRQIIPHVPRHRRLEADGNKGNEASPGP